MDKKKIRATIKKGNDCMNSKTRPHAVSYHLKCAKTANGLTHFVMYGDVSRKKMPL